MQMNKTDLIKMVAEKANKPTNKRFWYFQKDYSASSDS